MATRQKRRYVRHNRAHRRRNAGTGKGRSWSSYTRKRRNPRVKRYQRRRRSNVTHRRHYRRNPGFLTGTAGRVLGVVGGVAVTKLLSGFIPASFSTGVLSYLATGVIAFAQGKLVGKVSKNAQLGNDFMVGGIAYLVAKILNDFFPTVGAYTGISGMGMIGGSSFYTPQVNLGGSMGNFVTPGSTMRAISAAGAIAPASASLGRLRRTGRIM